MINTAESIDDGAIITNLISIFKNTDHFQQNSWKVMLFRIQNLGPFKVKPMIFRVLMVMQRCFFPALSFLMSELKSKIEIDQMAGVVYYIPCQDCGIGYVGQTKQVLKNKGCLDIGMIKQKKQRCITIKTLKIIGLILKGPRFWLLKSITFRESCWKYGPYS